MVNRPEVPGPVLLLGSVVTVQVGLACGKAMFAVAGTAGVIVLRLGFAALVLLLLRRPRAPDRAARGTVAALGVAIAGMHLIYPALERLPVGVASTLQFLGPLTLALVRARRPLDLLWAALAGTGVLLIYRPFGDPVSPSGAALALGAGACMAAYLVLTRRAGALAGAPLAWGVAVAALLVLPLAPLAEGAVLRPGVLAAGLGVALLSAVVPWSLDRAALRRMPEQAAAVMVSLEPAAAALAGLVLLGERLGPAAWLAVACVSAASAGVACTQRRPREPAAPAPPPEDDRAPVTRDAR